MIDVVRNMTRRKVRTGLTVLGIVIGIFALTVMGAMAEKMNLLVAGGLDYYGGHVTVLQGDGAGMSGLPISTKRIPQIARVQGVAAVAPVVDLLLKTDDNGVSFGMPDTIEGIGAAATGHETLALSAAAGTIPPLSQRGVVAVGSSIAREFKLHVGDTFKVRGRPFVVKAILQTTMTAPDSMVRMNLRDAQELYVAALPPMLRASVQPGDVASALNVYPARGVD